MANMWISSPRRPPQARRATISSRAVQIESLSASGRSRQTIAETVGCAIEYVNQVLRFQANTLADHGPWSDDEKHLRLIHRANKGRGLPFLDLSPSYRVRS